MEARGVVDDRMNIVGLFKWDIKHLYTQNMIRNHSHWRESKTVANPESCPEIIQITYLLHLLLTPLARSTNINTWRTG
jgi:hypothetical protein